MSRSHIWILCALLIGGGALPGGGRSASADEGLTPRAALRAAAEQLAEVEPGAPPREAAANIQKTRPPAASPLDKREALQVAMREAVEAEVARELQIHEPHGRGRPASTGKADSAAESSGKEASEQERGAALQAQGAKAIGLQHSQGLAKGHTKSMGLGNGNGNGNGNSNLNVNAIRSGRASAVGSAARFK